VIVNFNRWAERRDAEAKNPPAPEASTTDEPPTAHTYTPFMESIHLAACAANQVLPMSPDLPADLFTCCLTSPIEIALRFFVLQDPLRLKTESGDPRSRITVDLVMKIPGDLKDRRTPLGELNWIFTAVTDTIAWLSFPRSIFNRLFRQDLLVAALFRNFLLANRIMRAYHCTPVSHPELPMTHNHPLWNSWDLAVDACLSQLPDMIDADPEVAPVNPTARDLPPARPPVVYQQSLFFAEHLQAFEVWLQHGGVSPGSKGIATGAPRSPPEQLPIVLQVLLSQAHRLRALILLSRFVDLGPWAVHLALSIGIFPYVQKLLQSPAVELKPVLIFIWARILAVDKSCQVDLLKDAGYNYFAHILSPFTTGGPPLLIPNASEHRAMCAFILSMLCRGFRQGQLACMSMHVFESCFARLSEDDWLLKQWCLLCVAQLWADHDEAKALALREGYQDHLLQALRNPAVEVRAAALYALGTFLGASALPRDSDSSQGGGGTGAQIGIGEREQLQVEAGIAYTSLLRVKEDASPMVRKELVILLSCVVREWRGWFVCAAWAYLEQETLEANMKAQVNNHKSGPVEEDGEDLVSATVRAWVENPGRSDEEHRENVTILASFKAMFEALLDLSVDPHAEVSVMASTVVDYIVALLIDSAFRRVQGSSLRQAHRPRAQTAASTHSPLPTTPTVTPGFALSPLSAPPPLARTESEVSFSSRQGTLKRTASVANAIRSLATITGFLPTDSRETTSPASEASAPFEPALTSANHAHYRSPYPLPKAPGPETTARTAGTDSVPRSASIGSLLNAHMRANGGLGSSASDRFHNAPVSAVAVLEYLTEEDMERLRIRRLKGTQAGGDADGRSANQGVPRPNDLGLGMVAKEVQDDVLPLKSGFFDWSVEYFREPQMKVRPTKMWLTVH
jgi:regulator-associated protein of mTOR